MLRERNRVNYITQGETLEELQENLRDIYDDLTSARFPVSVAWLSSTRRELPARRRRCKISQSLRPPML